MPINKKSSLTTNTYITIQFNILKNHTDDKVLNKFTALICTAFPILFCFWPYLQYCFIKNTSMNSDEQVVLHKLVEHFKSLILQYSSNIFWNYTNDRVLKEEELSEVNFLDLFTALFRKDTTWEKSKIYLDFSARKLTYTFTIIAAILLMKCQQYYGVHK